MKIKLRWRDLDHQGHVYHAAVLTLLDEARTEWLRDELGMASPDEYVLARIDISYLHEIVLSDDHVSVTFVLERIGTTSLTLGETLTTSSGVAAARATVTAVLWDRATRRPRPLTVEERGTAVSLSATEAGVAQPPGRPAQPHHPFGRNV